MCLGDLARHINISGGNGYYLSVLTLLYGGYDLLPSYAGARHYSPVKFFAIHSCDDVSGTLL